MKPDSALGWTLLLFGVVLVLPITSNFFRWFGELQLRAMPWIRQLPGGGFYENFRLQNTLRIVIGMALVVGGLLAVFGIVDFS
jgi:hypothetical protein